MTLNNEKSRSYPDIVVTVEEEEAFEVIARSLKRDASDVVTPNRHSRAITRGDGPIDGGYGDRFLDPIVQEGLDTAG